MQPAPGQGTHRAISSTQPQQAGLGAPLKDVMQQWEQPCLMLVVVALASKSPRWRWVTWHAILCTPLHADDVRLVQNVNHEAPRCDRVLAARLDELHPVADPGLCALCEHGVVQVQPAGQTAALAARRCERQQVMEHTVTAAQSEAYWLSSST